MEIQRLVTTENGGIYSTFKSHGHWLATPTSYMTDASKYTYKKFDDLVRATNHPATAGKSVNTYGTVRDAASLGMNSAQQAAIEY